MIKTLIRKAALDDHDIGPSLRGAILIFPGVEELDFIGVYEVLTKVKTLAVEGELALVRPPEVLLIAREQRIECANGLTVLPHRRYSGLAGFDLVVVPGGRGVNTLQADRVLLEDLARFQESGGVLCSVCTGALVLAWSGVLQKRRATTHHAHRAKLAAFCRVAEERVVIDGNIITAAGVSSSLDLGLALVERFYGAEAARRIARRIEYRPPAS